MAYLSLVALFLTLTNFVPVSAIGFVPILLCAWRFYGRTYPPFITSLVVFTAYALLSTLMYDPASLIDFEFYRRDGNFFVSYAPLLAGCVYVHRWDLNKVLKWFFVFAILANLPAYAIYLSQYGLLSLLTNPVDTFGGYFIARNAAGGFFAMLFCLGIACYMYQRSRLILALLVINGAFLFSTYSRGSMLGVAAMLPYLLLGRKRWILVVTVAGLIAASFAVGLHNLNSSTDYMGYTFTINNPDAKTANLDIRYEWLWPRAITYFRHSPIFGLGFGSFDDQISNVVDYFSVFAQPLGVEVFHTDSHAHNSYLNILAELGIVGLAFLLRFYWQLIGWAASGSANASKEGGRNYIAFVFIELSSMCLLAMSYSEHRLTTPSNVLIMTLVGSLLLASRVHNLAPARTSRSVVPEPSPVRRLDKA
ncbi:O-antigen ligase [Paraburkholderia sp. BL6669N2]|uniref:O-antigen ligase family protein n=1 Tax=Paraburkholderia sp. BL6669N2 TaxID=1938807 RepID=UPI000E2612E0|nr:O-antigen ligase family protein [Paraburkholderia sp. BL6669N2]REG61206.1 O-antigen ligase [Paraburkholderia sp. BL6669N2]